jgi:sporulation protein YlmC with PRC-barrel domain
MNTSHVNGLSVVSIGTGERLGSVSEILLDPTADRIAAFAIDDGASGGLLSSQPPSTRWVNAQDVHAIGPDAMTVQDDSVLRDSAGDTDMTPLSVLVGEKVVTEGGTYVGQVAAAEIDETSMNVTGLEVSPGFFKSNTVVGKAELITVGDAMVIVADSVCGPGASSVAEEPMMDATVEESTIYGAPRDERDEQ